MKYLFILITLCLLSLDATAQREKQVTITGTVFDKDLNQPLEYATVSFLDKNSNEIVNGGVTNTKGVFEIDVPSGVYDVTVEYISYETRTFSDRTFSADTDMGRIGIGINVEALDAVQVIAERTTVEIKLDKKIYNIGKDLTTSGGTVSDALNNVPSVSVDIDGAISLRGNENVRILINGKPSALAGFGDNNVLSQLPAEAIERVEVITSPSARYTAEGTAGILNIILRQKETLGFNGSLNAYIGDPLTAGFSTNLNLRNESFNIFSNIGYRYSTPPRRGFSDTEYFDRVVNGETRNPEFDRIIEDNDVDRLNRNFNVNLGLEYFLTKKSSLTTSIFYRIGNDKDTGVNDSRRFVGNSLVEQTVRTEIEGEEDDSYQISLNYVNNFDDGGHKLTVDFQFENDKEVESTNINEDYITTQQVDPEGFQEERILADEDQKEYLIQADYVLPIGEDSRFEAGFRGNYENQVTDYDLRQENLATGQLVVNDTLTNIFDYTENVTALYSQYGTKWGKFSFLLGLRLENTTLKGDIESKLSAEELEESYGFPIQTKFDNDYLGLFPTVNLIYNLDNDEDRATEESITLGYNRRINRPRGFFINPFPSRSSRTNVFQGNPNLRPAFSSAFDLGYLKRWEKITLTSSVYYQYESDSFERVQEDTGQQTTDGIDIIRSIFVNLSSNQRTGAELGLLYNPEKWLRLNGSFNIFKFKTEGDFNGINYDAENTSWFARFSSKVTLPAKIDWQTNAFYRGAQQGAQTDRDPIFSLDLAFSKDILKDNATISLNVRDLLNSRKFQGTTTTDFFERYSEFQWRQRQITLNFVYRFNEQKRRQRGGQGRGGDDDFEFEG